MLPSQLEEEEEVEEEEKDTAETEAMALDPNFQQHVDDRFQAFGVQMSNELKQVKEALAELKEQAVLGCRNQTAFVLNEVQLLSG